MGWSSVFSEDVLFFWNNVSIFAFFLSFIYSIFPLIFERGGSELMGLSFQRNRTLLFGLGKRIVGAGG